MSTYCDYFSAATDEAAATVIDFVGGPSEAPGPGFEPVELKGIDPIVQMGKLEELLTGVAYETVIANSRHGNVISSRDDGEVLVVTLTDELRTALAHAPDSQLRAVVVPWSRMKEFWGPVDTSDLAELAELLIELSSLARLALARNDHLYCWVSV